MASASTCLVLAYAFLSFASTGAGVWAEISGHPDVSPGLQEILDRAHQGPLYSYPTSLTQGIVPVGLRFCLVWRWIWSVLRKCTYLFVEGDTFS